MGTFDLSKEYGVVLEGGGAKGAYQIGVWKAMMECGVKIKGVSGVSVGALNGAMMCMQDIELAEQVWENISYSQVMEVDDEQMDYLLKRNLKELDLKKVTKTGVKVLADKGLDVTPLRNLIEEVVDEEKIKNSPIEFVLGTFSLDGFKEKEIVAQEAEDGYLKDYLLASAYFPAFKNEKLHGRKYMDGGVINNVPIDMLLNRGYEDILVIRIFGIGMEKKVKIPENVNVVQIAPRVNLGNLLEFESQKSRRNMKIGYYDGLRCFCSLKGKIYYIDSKWTEEDCMLRLIRSSEIVQMALLEYYKQEYTNLDIYKREMLEIVAPGLAQELKLGKGWTYQELYLALIELSAKYMRVPKYQVYTEEELLEEIKKRYEKAKTKIQSIKSEKQKEEEASREMPLFVELVLNLLVME
ncbi:MAG: patatin-like phospholipase family protein [Lachnospiraceae bacterium]|nr:patatin-like phospholipase family protein [Lachnospiraceae bacterium]